MMNNNNSMQTYVARLEQEIQWVEKLNAILVEEKNILETRQFTKLEAIAQQKDDLSTKLEESAKERINLAKPSENNSVADFLKNSSPDDSILLKKLNDRLAEQLILCRDLNMVNGQVIASNLHTRQEIVDSLSGNKSAADVYTASGNVHGTNDSKHHQEA